MENDFEARINALKIEYEQKMGELSSQKDQEREDLRAEMQARIDQLLQQIEDEKQNMGAAGQRRE